MMQGIDVGPITASSAISLGLVIALIGLIWKQAVWQTKMTICLESIQKEMKKLGTIDRRVIHLEQGLELLEEDFNNLWARVDNRPLDKSRKARFRPLLPEKDDE